MRTQRHTPTQTIWEYPPGVHKCKLFNELVNLDKQTIEQMNTKYETGIVDEEWGVEVGNRSFELGVGLRWRGEKLGVGVGSWE